MYSSCLGFTKESSTFQYLIYMYLSSVSPSSDPSYICTRPCNLPRYVCSRGPLRPTPPSSPHPSFPFSCYACTHRELHHLLPPLIHIQTYTPTLGRGLPAFRTGNVSSGQCMCAQSLVTLTRCNCSRSQGRKSRRVVVAATGPAICWTCFSLIRAFLPYTPFSTHRPRHGCILSSLRD